MIRPLLLAGGLAMACCTFSIGRAQDPDAEKVQALLGQAATAAAAGNSARAVELTSQAIAVDAAQPDAYYLRGREQFRLGKIAESIADFDRLVALQPRVERQLWERGISHYYAGQFADGARQFELYQTYHDNDVENSVWRYLCMARSEGVDKARAQMLEIKDDRRVPMMQIYDLYRGQLQPQDVLAAARAGDPPAAALNVRLFYAHLYLGLFYEAAGQAELAREHLIKAADDHKIGHYMWDVAHVHAARLRAGENK